MQRCPVCRNRLKQPGPCTRCGLELDKLRQIDRLADAHFHASITLMAQGEPARALHRIKHALALHRSPLYLTWQSFLTSQEHSEFPS